MVITNLVLLVLLKFWEIENDGKFQKVLSPSLVTQPYQASSTRLLLHQVNANTPKLEFLWKSGDTPERFKYKYIVLRPHFAIPL